ncbi:DUF1456 family protein [Persicirhabdus sediminis]|uniref:DUF1456 family protein n=1 Tax=Persicirhabdus sediminis TaxID=454144 RepID=A0A8J7MCY2_9BACT|nr:DUF1456 family protein [Persicirhabdus sediminis]MBK1790228.1 DUF1456 family protein [Persicirhabdus sediminis]
MNNNDILRRLRYAFNFTDVQVSKIIAHVGAEVQPAQVAGWLQREGHKDYQALTDVDLCQFLDGLIIERRGPRPDGTVPEALSQLSRNEILKKLRIALNLREEGMLTVFEQAEFVVTKAELGSFFRKYGHRHYADCPEQVLRKFIAGLGHVPS